MVLRRVNNLVPDGTGLAPKIASGKSEVSAGNGTRLWRTSHAGGRVEIAANNGHIQASPQPIPNPYPRSMMTLTFEDFTLGHFGTFGPRHVTREEILAFAAEFDPQPMHLDEAAANASMLKGLSGSGWHLGS